MSAFEIAVEFVLGWEKEWSYDELGGKTHWGIAQKMHPEIDVEKDIKTIEDAKDFYKTYYWDKVSGDMLPPALAFMTFDCAVNQGISRACRWMQRAVDTVQDGIVGPNTLQAANSKPPLDSIREMVAHRIMAYTGCPRWFQDGLGWVRRVAGCAIECTLMQNSIDISGE